MEMTGKFPFSAAFRAVGDNGTLDYRLSAGFNIENLGAADNRLTLYAEGKEPEAVSWDQADSFRNELESFASAVEENKAVPIPPEESVYCIRVIEALKKSLETGVAVHL
jgi:predicted dehydrogenase